ncbi:MAG: HAMP domain-containing histidine kinase [Hamadaea sp.]|uniref:sensor histidine kinase n=1 Tax=Hamadaea sp. TaxID=2024425 RepID=UPI0018438D36|nr:HAMP domain-containing sensor histidine kinase [Hamadaea sp.]NUR70699.1 HAMP domain-containing histidine kinase [Hamadaea sp.]NUT21791.1 HAMP domain-containing histidine kinase [Hamadaea sp.]
MNRLSIRVRLTLLYTSVFFVCGAVVVAISYGLLASLSSVAPKEGQQERDIFFMQNPEQFIDYCRQVVNTTTDENLRHKCETAFAEGVRTGAQTQREATLSHLLQYSAIALIAVTLLAALAGWLVAGRVLRPVHQITAAARAASEHNLSARVGLAGPHDELRELADTFDAMLARLEASFASQRRFIANASHELRTPLAVMGATVDVVLAKPAPTPEELLAMGRDVRTGVDQAEAVVGALLTLARNDYGLTVREPVDLATAVEDALETVEYGNRVVHADLEPAATTGDPVLLERLAANLIDNAIRYNLPGGQVWITTCLTDGQAVLEVVNTGPFVLAERVDDLFKPFQRLHDGTTRDGLGLGLAIVASIASVHGGTVAAVARPDGGLRVSVTLPSA